MKIDEAINILDNFVKQINPANLPPHLEAIILSYFALKYVKMHRELKPKCHPNLLPGEDK